MKNFDIFIKQNKNNNKIEDIVLIKTGFNFYACIFNVLWLIFNRLWLFLFLSIFYIYAIKIIFSGFASTILLTLSCILLGFEAENLLLYSFKKDNYFFVGFSMGRDEDDAKIKFLDQVNKENKEEGKVIY